MKRIAIALIALFVAGSLFAGGKECQIKNARNVELTGTMAKVGSGDDAKTVFRVASSDESYTVCEKTKASLIDVSGATVKVKGKVMHCGDGEELIIESSRKI